MRTILLLPIALLVLVSCNQTTRDVKVIDPTQTSNSQTPQLTDGNYRPLKVAVAAILSPRETFESYEDIFRIISDELNMPIEFHQRRTYGEINQMLEEGKLDFAFICSGAYIELDKESGVELLAVPVSGGEPYYKAYIIAGPNVEASRLEDLRNASFAFTDPMSNTGYLYARYRLQQLGEDPEDFFSSTLFTYGHDTSIQMVSRGVVDAASVSHMVYEFIRSKTPERLQGVRIIEISEPFGMPPVVVSSRMDPQVRGKVSRIFMEMHNNPEARELINSLLIDSFVKGDDDAYNSIRQLKANVYPQ